MTLQSAILLVAHGTQAPGGEAVQEAVLSAARQRFPGLPAVLAFSSCRDLSDARGGRDVLARALRGLVEQGVKRVAAQSLHLARGRNFSALSAKLSELARDFGLESFRLGRPLLDGPEDILKASQAIFSNLPQERCPGEAVVLLGHGSPDSPNQVYLELARLVRGREPLLRLGILQDKAESGGVHPELGFAGISADLAAAGVKKAWLMPLFCVVGRHAREDLAGKGPDSWRSRLQAAGIKCQARLIGAAQCPEFVDIWLEHLRQALDGNNIIE